MSKLSYLLRPINFIFLIQVVLVFLIAFGLIDRGWIVGLAILVSVFILSVKLETSVAFFARSVPVFVAVPFTDYFDSFNLWRIAAGLIFLKWLCQKYQNGEWKKTSQKILGRFKKYAFFYAYAVFIVCTLFSLFAASDLFSGFKRIVYILNLSLIGPVIYDLVKARPALAKELMKNIVIAGVIVAAVGLMQLVSAYLMDIFAFMNFWDGMVQLGFYGKEWAEIAAARNTWFAYFGPNLSLRMFSTFPDSHSFPVFLLLVVPSLMTLSLFKVFGGQERLFKKIANTRASWLIFLLPLFYLLVILSGTRGIWLAVLAPFLLGLWLNRRLNGLDNKNIIRYLSALFLLFFFLFGAAYPIFDSSQFQVERADSQALTQRLRSIWDPDEISNFGRLSIWGKTLGSIVKRPWLGVGIGNYPVVLSQNPEWAKAGSSAHNLYLHIIAEVGIFGGAAVLFMFWLILKRSWEVFRRNQNLTFKIFSASFLLYFVWVAAYNLTDAIMFDERVFLIFVVNTAMIFGLHWQQKSP